MIFVLIAISTAVCQLGTDVFVTSARDGTALGLAVGQVCAKVKVLEWILTIVVRPSDSARKFSKLSKSTLIWQP